MADADIQEERHSSTPYLSYVWPFTIGSWRALILHLKISMKVFSQMHPMQSISMLLVLDKNLAAARLLPCLPSYHQLHLPSTHWRLHRWLRRRINSVKESEFILFYSCCAKSMAEMTNLPFPPIIRLCFIRYDFTSGWPQKSNTNLNCIQNKEEESACLNMNKIVLTLSEA